jgi:hypothetical protein
VRRAAVTESESVDAGRFIHYPATIDPALAPMYTAIGLTSLDLVICNWKLRWAGHVRRMDWLRLPRKFLTSWVDASRCRGRTHSYGHDLTRELQLIGFNTDRAAVQLGVLLSWGAAAQDREK